MWLSTVRIGVGRSRGDEVEDFELTSGHAVIPKRDRHDVRGAASSRDATGHKCFHRVGDRVAVANEGEVGFAIEFNQLGPGDVSGQIATILDGAAVTGAVDDEGGDIDQREEVAYVDVESPCRRLQVPGAAAESLQLSHPFAKRRDR